LKLLAGPGRTYTTSFERPLTEIFLRSVVSGQGAGWSTCVRNRF